ncbi:hypothetical protein NN561_018716 [Cricetulus griseus]
MPWNTRGTRAPLPSANALSPRNSGNGDCVGAEEHPFSTYPGSLSCQLAEEKGPTQTWGHPASCPRVLGRAVCLTCGREPSFRDSISLPPLVSCCLAS